MRRPGTTSGGPVRLVDVELSGPIAEVGTAGVYEQVRVLVRLHRRPLGTVIVDLVDGGVGCEKLAGAIWDELADAIRSHCRLDGLDEPRALTALGLLGPSGPLSGALGPSGPLSGARGPTDGVACSWRASLGATPPPLATVVITTCGGPERRLLSTLGGVLAQTYPRFEVVVVDNRPATSGVRQVLEAAYPAEERLRYAAEARPGLSHARNRGVAVARGELVAFADDDLDIDVDWLGCLVAGFDSSGVACVTGLILPIELETSAQRLLEEFGGYAKGFERRTWDCDEHRLDHPLYPYTVGAFGSGASAAFRRDALVDIGGFDTALGAGTRARGGEDIDIYVTCVQRGYQIVYEPGAIVRHAHLREIDQIHRKVRDYGVGLGAMLTKHLLRDRSSFASVMARVPAGARHLLSGSSPKNTARTSTYPTSLVLAELAGIAYGPVAYLRSRAAS